MGLAAACLTSFSWCPVVEDFVVQIQLFQIPRPLLQASCDAVINVNSDMIIHVLILVWCADWAGRRNKVLWGGETCPVLQWHIMSEPLQKSPFHYRQQTKHIQWVRLLLTSLLHLYTPLLRGLSGGVNSGTLWFVALLLSMQSAAIFDDIRCAPAYRVLLHVWEDLKPFWSCVQTMRAHGVLDDVSCMCQIQQGFVQWQGYVQLACACVVVQVRYYIYCNDTSKGGSLSPEWYGQLIHHRIWSRPVIVNVVGIHELCTKCKGSLSAGLCYVAEFLVSEEIMVYNTNGLPLSKACLPFFNYSYAVAYKMMSGHLFYLAAM